MSKLYLYMMFLFLNYIFGIKDYYVRKKRVNKQKTRHPPIITPKKNTSPNAGPRSNPYVNHIVFPQKAPNG